VLLHVVVVLAAGCGRILFDERAPRDGGTIGGAIDAPDGPLPPFDITPLDAVVPSGLVVWFPFDDASPQDAADVVSGFGGTCSGGGCPKTDFGQHGGAFLFDGIDDCIEVANMGQFGQAQITIAIWMRQDVSDNCSPVAKPATALGATANTWQIETSTTNQIMFTSSHGGLANTRIAALSSLVIGQWHHVAATFDGATKRLYVDGAMASSAALPNALAYDVQPVWIGCDNNNGTPAMRFNGAIDDFQLYNRALSTAEIQALAAM
jgi:hypothetical protein